MNGRTAPWAYFDGVFNTGPQQDAARAQVQGIQSGLQGLQGAFQGGQADLRSNYGNAINALGGTFGQGQGALSQNYLAGIAPFLQNYGQAQQGSNALANALGLNGQAGSDAAVKAFQANPGYQFGLQQGENAIAAQAQAGGMGASGNALNAADQFAQNYANQGWNNYLQQLQPYLGASNAAAGGIQQGFSGLGSGLNQNNMALGGALAGTYTGLGNQLNQSQMNLGNATYGANASIGNAYANADLAQAGANANILNTVGQGAKAIFGMMSDEQMKDDIEPVGELYDGQKVYRYRMKGDPRHQIGLIAQEVEAAEPDAVMQFTPHVKGVDYRRATNRAAEIAKTFIEAM